MLLLSTSTSALLLPSLPLPEPSSEAALAAYVGAFSATHVGLSAVRDGFIAGFGRGAGALGLVGKEGWVLPAIWLGDGSTKDDATGQEKVWADEVLAQRYEKTFVDLAVTIIAAFTFPLGWVAMDWREYGLLALAAFGFGLGIYSMTESLRFAAASVVAPYKYSAIVWALILGYLFWGEMPTPMLWGGTALIIASGIAVLYEQHDATR